MKCFIQQDITVSKLASLLKIPRQLLEDCNEGLSKEIYLRGTNAALPALSVSNSADCGLRDELSVYIKLHNIPAYLPAPIIHLKETYSSTDCYSDIQLLSNSFPFVRKSVIGQSVLGQPIIELSLGRGPKKVHLNGSFHANEWITSCVTMSWLFEYVTALLEDSHYRGYKARDLYNETTLSVVPMVNPDGVDLVLENLPKEGSLYEKVKKINGDREDFSQWKANIRGVDLNNQYPANWEIEKIRKIPQSPAPRDYPGDRPLTEPEAQCMAQLVKDRNFDRVVAFHTQGEEIYWGYLGREPQEAEMIVNEYAALSGYLPVRDIDSHAGFRDWFINERKLPGYTVELGIGSNPLPIGQFTEIADKSRGIFWASLYM
ncbi:peptidase M14 [Bacillus lacus]|uniref:Peptidase M14 n=1 Tax=Metabacillus lacus TaxID=1983721 RepID=A0A7X2IZM7_9BACI|nr:M14 family metallocarboxypeptidase [Metabacillus lacus]MRX72625.1 peptidase M14 [Metabacillus lacus]